MTLTDAIFITNPRMTGEQFEDPYSRAAYYGYRCQVYIRQGDASMAECLARVAFHHGMRTGHPAFQEPKS